VIRALDELIETWGKPWRLRLDNGPELVSRALEHCAWHQAIELVFIQLGKPTQNAYMEGFNRTYRTEVLSCYVFNSLSEVRHMTEHWRHRYNLERPYTALDGNTTCPIRRATITHNLYFQMTRKHEDVSTPHAFFALR
jgi:putative transposase